MRDYDFENVAGGWVYFSDAAHNGYMHRVRVDGTDLQKEYALFFP